MKNVFSYFEKTKGNKTWRNNVHCVIKRFSINKEKLVKRQKILLALEAIDL